MSTPSRGPGLVTAVRVALGLSGAEADARAITAECVGRHDDPIGDLRFDHVGADSPVNWAGSGCVFVGGEVYCQLVRTSVRLIRRRRVEHRSNPPGSGVSRRRLPAVRFRGPHWVPGSREPGPTGRTVARRPRPPGGGRRTRRYPPAGCGVGKRPHPAGHPGASSSAPDRFTRRRHRSTRWRRRPCGGDSPCRPTRPSAPTVPAHVLPHRTPAQLLAVARHGLAEAARTRPDGLRYAAAHLAALRAAAALLAARARPVPDPTHRITSVWVLLVRRRPRAGRVGRASSPPPPASGPPPRPASPGWSPPGRPTTCSAPPNSS